MLDAVHGCGARDHSLKLFGVTQDLSETGVLFYVPHVAIDEVYCSDDAGQTLQVMLFLPAGSVEMEVAPVRCIPSDSEHPENGSFLAAKIAEIGKDGVDRFRNFLGAQLMSDKL
jgi:hypothetical protein